jgi:uncharacterized protein (DUF1778 family)
MFLLGAFLAGSAIGYAADRTFTDQRGHGRPYTEKSMRDELQLKLNLTPAQRAIMDSALDWRRSRTEELMTPIQPQLDAARDTSRQRIMASLDSTQKTTFMKILDDMRKKSDTGRRATGGTR